MANICTNIFYAETSNKENLKKIKSFLQEEFHCDNLNEDEVYIEAYFDSRWTYPKEHIDRLVASLELDEELYIRILSHELSNEYVAFKVYRFGQWDIRY